MSTYNLPLILLSMQSKQNDWSRRETNAKTYHVTVRRCETELPNFDVLANSAQTELTWNAANRDLVTVAHMKHVNIFFSRLLHYK